MFSYRHAFHAGNHADVLKHITLIAILEHMTAKATALTVIDTHAGAGLYRLDGDYSTTGDEARDGVLKLFGALRGTTAPAAAAAPTPVPPDSRPKPAKSLVKESKSAVQDVAPSITRYLDLVASFNRGGSLKVYPGSPFVVNELLRAEARDKLKLFEMHPTDSKALAANIGQLEAGRQIAVARADGFESLKALLPPPNRRALVLIDPSYELKTDYPKVSACILDSLKRFSTGTYAVWYPVIPRPEAHDLPRRLKTLATQAGKPWLQATLAIGQDPTHGPDDRPGLTASGMFVINPPHTLKATLQEALPQLLTVLGRGRGQGQTLAHGG
jgi:23S rRNA (adenine2030-N6)-methyltransferase